MHRYKVFIEDVWKPDSIEIIESPLMIETPMILLGGLNVCEPENKLN
jgi:hypothetical protein